MQLVLTLHASWSVPALGLHRDGCWTWLEVVVHPDWQDTTGLPCLRPRATALLRASLGLVPHTPLWELCWTYGPRALAGAPIVVAFQSHVDAADEIVVPYMGPGAHWLSLEELLEAAMDPRPGLLAFARLAAIGAREWTFSRGPPDGWSPPLPPLAQAQAPSSSGSESGTLPEQLPARYHAPRPRLPASLPPDQPLAGASGTCSPAAALPLQWHCPLCNVVANSAVNFREHLLGRPHLQRTSFVLSRPRRAGS